MIIHEYLMRIYQDEMLAEAERNRLILKAKNSQVGVPSYYARSMTWLGNLMCIWGSLLEKRFRDKTANQQSGSIEKGLNV